MSATIEQIAQRVGVSPGTVSRVLNGKNKENRPAIAKRAERIRRVAAELGYRPNVAARQMLRGRFDLIALLNCGDLGFDWFPRSLLHGIHEKTASFGSRLAITEIEGRRFQDPDYAPDVLRESMVDGLIVHLGTHEEKTAGALFERDPLPVVYVNHKAELHSVYPDDVAGGEMAARGLIEAGHTEIGFLTGGIPSRRGAHHSEPDRAEGFGMAMRDAGLRPDRLCVDADYDRDDAVPYARRFLERYPDMTGVVTYKIELAISLREAAALTGRLNDLSIVCFHEREFHAATGIPMPTLVIPFRKVGETAAEMVEALIRKPDRPMRSRAVPYRWFDRKDTILPPRVKR